MEFNGTFLVTIISFVLFVFVMNKILYEPINNIVAQRREFVDENLRTAEKNHKKKNDILKNAQFDADNELMQTYENLNNLSNEAKEGLKGRMTDLANDIVEKMIGYRSEVQGFDNDAVNRILYQG